jgi:PAS domain S-box-containing protein
MSLAPTHLQPDPEFRYRSLFEHSLDAVLLTAPDGRIAMANAACTELLGYTEEELRVLGRHAVVDPSDPRLAAALEERRRTGRFRGELRLKHKDGRRIEVELSSALFRDGQGGEWTSMFIRDITARKGQEAERDRLLAERDAEREAIRASERLLNGIFQLLPVGLWIADRSGRIVRANPAGERIWAGARYVGPKEFGQYRGWWADTGKPIDAQEWAVARALSKGETSIGEMIRIQCFDDSFKTIRNSALPLYDERGAFAGAVIVNEDITQLKETEAALRRAVRSREQVLGVVAHDLRNPLQVIDLQAQVLLRPGGWGGDQREAAETIRRQVQRMDRLIQDLLDVTRIEAGTLTLARSRAAPQALLEEALRAHRSIAAAGGLELRCEAQAGMPEVEADRGRIAQVLDNLVGNAVKFTPPGGSIALGAEAGGGDVVFRVRDTGIGMDEKALRHVFEPLWQAQASRRGMGLGLAIAKAIVEAHGGRIWAESSPGAGATFFFSLPAIAR